MVDKNYFYENPNCIVQRVELKILRINKSIFFIMIIIITNLSIFIMNFQEEYERISDWIQQTDIEIKAQKNALVSTLQEKEKQVATVQGLSDRLDKGEEMINKFNEMASGLLSSHLDTYVNNQLRHLNSRYQVYSSFKSREIFRIFIKQN